MFSSATACSRRTLQLFVSWRCVNRSALVDRGRTTIREAASRGAVVLRLRDFVSNFFNPTKILQESCGYRGTTMAASGIAAASGPATSLCCRGGGASRGVDKRWCDKSGPGDANIAARQLWQASGSSEHRREHSCGLAAACAAAQRRWTYCCKRAGATAAAAIAQPWRARRLRMWQRDSSVALPLPCSIPREGRGQRSGPPKLARDPWENMAFESHGFVCEILNCRLMSWTCLKLFSVIILQYTQRGPGQRSGPPKLARDPWETVKFESCGGARLFAPPPGPWPVAGAKTV